MDRPGPLLPMLTIKKYFYNFIILLLTRQVQMISEKPSHTIAKSKPFTDSDDE